MDPLHYQPQGHIYVINTCKGHSGLSLWAFSEGNASSHEKDNVQTSSVHQSPASGGEHHATRDCGDQQTPDAAARVINTH